MQTEAEKNEVYDMLTDNGPDVLMWTPAFTRLVSKAKKAGVLGDRRKLYAWLLAEGMFGPKSDSLRGNAPFYS